MLSRQINQLLVEELLMSPLCIDSKYAQALMMSAYAAFSTGQPLANNRYEAAYAVNPRSGEKETTNYTAGSVGMVVIDGPIVSHSEPWYGIKGTIEAAQELQMLDGDTNIIGTVLYLETGGGAVYALKPILDVLNTLEKPVVVYSKQILASAGYRIAANTNWIMMYHPQGIVGSLGTMSSFSDMQPMFEKWGMKFFEYYATESILKNKTYRDAKDGDGKALINNILDPMNELFISDIKELRGHLISKTEKSIYQGETFMAGSHGLSYGLIDSIGNLQDAVAKVVELANDPEFQKSHTQKLKQSNTMFGNKFPKMAALAKVAAGSITADQVQAVNEEIVAANIEGVTLCLNSELEKIAGENKAASTSAADLSTANARITTLEAELKTANEAKEKAEADLKIANDAHTASEAKVVSLTTESANWKAKAIEFGAKEADVPTTGVQSDTDKIEDTNSGSADFMNSEADEELAAIKASRKQLPNSSKK